MKAQKDPKTGRWLIQYRYTDWTGARKKSTKRGFGTKREAEQWYYNFASAQRPSLDMTFAQFVDAYYEDLDGRIKANAMRTKRYIIDYKLTPYLGNLKMTEINAVTIREWQKMMLKSNYKPTYLKTICNQLSAIFNYDVKIYDLPSNPCHKAGSIGRDRPDEMSFWTKEEFDKFIVTMMNKQKSYVSFMILYWMRIRVGELLALTIGDIDFEKKTMDINKSYQKIDGEDVITVPKTEKSKRVISIPKFLLDDIKDYMNVLPYDDKDDRLFPFTKSYIEHEMARGIKESKVKKIRVHDLRHSRVALLINMGMQIIEISRRLGHAKIETTINSYGHLYPDRQDKLANKLEEQFNGAW